MAKKEKRFVITYKEGNALSGTVQILVDKKTGVNYLWTVSGYSTGIAPLLDRDGKPIVTTVTDIEE